MLLATTSGCLKELYERLFARIALKEEFETRNINPLAQDGMVRRPVRQKRHIQSIVSVSS